MCDEDDFQRFLEQERQTDAAKQRAQRGMIDILIETDLVGGSARLTTQSAASKHGRPVLRVEAGDALGDFGPTELIGGVTAAQIVADWATCFDRTEKERAAAQRFLEQWPAGPQV